MHLWNNPLRKRVLPPAGEHRHERLKTADASESDAQKTSESEPAAKPKPLYGFMRHNTNVAFLYKNTLVDSVVSFYRKQLHPEVNVDLTLIPIIYNVLA